MRFFVKMSEIGREALPVMDESLRLAQKAVEREDMGSNGIYWVMFGLFGLVVIATVLTSIWKAAPDLGSFFGFRSSGATAENLFLPVGLFLKRPGLSASSEDQSEKIYLRSIGFRKAILLSEHSLKRGQEVWLSFKSLPYFHGSEDFIHGKVGAVRKLGDQWFISEIKIIHETARTDADLSTLIKDLQAVPG